MRGSARAPHGKQDARVTLTRPFHSSNRATFMNPSRVIQSRIGLNQNLRSTECSGVVKERGGCAAGWGRAWSASAVLLLVWSWSASTWAADAGEIKVGMSGALSGPAQALGQGIKAGIETYFRLANSAGGVHGRTLRLLTQDDAYEPGRAGPNVRDLIDRENVFAIVGNPGTPTAAVTIPIVNAKHVPFVGPFTGAGILRKTPPDRYVFNFRASYAQETAEMVRGLVTEAGIRPQDIAFFTQNDAYGDAGYTGAIAALKARGYAKAEELPHARYARNTLDVEGALARLLDPSIHPRAVIMIGAYRPCAKFITLARKAGMKAIFANVSFVLGEALDQALGSAAEGVVVTQVVPPLDSDLPALAEYRAVIPKSEASFVSLEGFLAAKVFVAALRKAGPGATREQLVDALEAGGAMDLGIGPLPPLSATRHQVSDYVWPTVIRNHHFRAFKSWAELRPATGSRL
jgi:ABC-type branched-subunit amino acid transport system substrate-binding protein